MILEAIVLRIEPNQNKEYEANFILASEIIKKAKGYISHELQQCIENENQYILLIKWETYENHMVDFRESEGFLKWRSLLSHFYATPPAVFHYKKVY